MQKFDRTQYRVLLFLLQQKVAIKPLRNATFFAYIISQKEEKTSGKKGKCFPINL